MKQTEFTVNYLTRCKECGGEDLSLTATRHDLGRYRVWHLGTVICLGCGRKVGGLGACEEQAKRAALITWERKNKDDSQEKEPDMREIKFRAWVKDWDEMVEVDGLGEVKP